MTLFRTMRPEELPTVLDWAAQEGWNPGLSDAEPFHHADPQGFFVAEQAGRPVAAISVVNHSAEVAFLGLYLCLPEFRGRGLGLGLWRHALAHAGARAVGLDGVAAQQANYARSGFVRTGATTRFEGPTLPQAHPAVRLLNEGDIAAVAALDSAANGFARSAFLQGWLRPVADRKTLIRQQGDRITGFVTIRRCRQGLKIGPLVAGDAAAALELIRAAVLTLPGTSCALDLPESNRALAQELSRLGYSATFATARMYRGTPPVTSSSLQAIATMELG